MKHIHIEGTGKPLKVVALELNKGAEEALTAGKEYTVIGYFGDYMLNGGWGCVIEDDNGVTTKLISEKDDFEVVGGNWIVTEREADSN